MENDLFRYVFDQSLSSREEVYDFLASQIDSQTLTQEEIKNKFLEREALGSIEIAQGVVLPHFEGAISRNKIIILKPKNSIMDWAKNIEKVDLIIALLLESEGDKTEVLEFVKKLASHNFIEQLKQKLTEESHGNKRYD